MVIDRGRSAGLLYLIMIVTTAFWFATTQSLLTTDSSAAFAQLQRSGTLFKAALIAGATGFTVFLVLGLALHRLFSPVSRDAANLMLTFMAVSVPLSLAAIARQVDALRLLETAPSLPGGAEQMQVMLALRGSDSLFLMSTIFSGLWLVPFGWLVIRSGFMPRAIGVLLIIGSIWYVLTVPGTIIDRGYATTLLGRTSGIVSGIPSLLGEMGACLWLVVMGARGRTASVSQSARVL